MSHGGTLESGALDHVKTLMRVVCKRCLPASPMTQSSFAVVLRVLMRVLECSPPSPFLQPSLSLLAQHAPLSDAFLATGSALLEAATDSGVESMAVALNDTLSVTLPLQWSADGALTTAGQVGGKPLFAKNCLLLFGLTQLYLLSVGTWLGCSVAFVTGFAAGVCLVIRLCPHWLGLVRAGAFLR